jgi:hypothetical protein
MEKLEINILTLKGSYLFNLAPVNDQSIRLFSELMLNFGLFKENELQQMTSQLKGQLSSFFNLHKPSFPILNKVECVFNSIPDSEYFLILPQKDSNTVDILNEHIFLESVNKAGNVQEIPKLIEQKTKSRNDLFSEVLNNYELLVPYTHKRYYIGESDKQKRICRFCGRSMNEGATFKSKAHAIPEAFGNKNIVLHEECDDCNNYFGSKVESDFLKYLDIYRVFWGIKGKKGSLKIEFENGFIKNENGTMFIYYSDGTSNKTGKPPESIILKSNQSLAEVNIYKTLCKIALSILDSKELNHFSQTVNWLSNDGMADTIMLPKVSVSISNQWMLEVPEIALYIRKNENRILPHLVGEFKLKNLVFVFIVPYSSKDSIAFIEETEYESFWNTFRHYKLQKNWSFNFYTSSELKKYQFKLNFEQRTVESLTKC